MKTKRYTTTDIQRAGSAIVVNRIVQQTMRGFRYCSASKRTYRFKVDGITLLIPKQLVKNLINSK